MLVTTRDRDAYIDARVIGDGVVDNGMAGLFHLELESRASRETGGVWGTTIGGGCIIGYQRLRHVPEHLPPWNRFKRGPFEF